MPDFKDNKTPHTQRPPASLPPQPKEKPTPKKDIQEHPEDQNTG